MSFILKRIHSFRAGFAGLGASKKGDRKHCECRQ